MIPQSPCLDHCGFQVEDDLLLKSWGFVVKQNWVWIPHLSSVYLLGAPQFAHLVLLSIEWNHEESPIPYMLAPNSWMIGKVVVVMIIIGIISSSLNLIRFTQYLLCVLHTWVMKSNRGPSMEHEFTGYQAHLFIVLILSSLEETDQDTTDLPPLSPI